MWLQVGPTEPEVQAKRDSFSVGAGEKLFSSSGGQFSSTAEKFRLRLASLVRNGNLYSAKRLSRKIHKCLDDSLPFFTSASLRAYAEFLLETFGRWKKPQPMVQRERPPNSPRLPFTHLGYAQVHNDHQECWIVKVTRRILFATPHPVRAQAASLRLGNGRKGQIDRAYSERDKLTLRLDLNCMARKTLDFSRNRGEFHNNLDLIAPHDNFLKPHWALRLMARLDGNKL